MFLRSLALSPPRPHSSAPLLQASIIQATSMVIKSTGLSLQLGKPCTYYETEARALG